MAGAFEWENFLEWCRLVHAREMFDLGEGEKGAVMVLHAMERYRWKHWGSVKKWIEKQRWKIMEWYVANNCQIV